MQVGEQRVSAFLQQRLYGRRTAVHACHHEWSGAVGRHSVNIGVVFQQQAYQRHMSAAGSVMQGGPAGFVHIGSFADHFFGERRLAFEAGQHQCTFILGIECIQI